MKFDKVKLIKVGEVQYTADGEVTAFPPDSDSNFWTIDFESHGERVRIYASGNVSIVVKY